MSRRLVWSLATIGGLIIVVAVLVGASFVSGSVRTHPDADLTVRLAMLDVPVADDQPVIENPDQYLGVLHPKPTFDTTGLGPELIFSQRPEGLEPLEPGTALRAVYLGHDQFGDPYQIWHAGSSNFRNLIGQVIVASDPSVVSARAMGPSRLAVGCSLTHRSGRSKKGA